MPPTPNDMKNFADKNRNNPKIIFNQMINTIITQLSPNRSRTSTSLRDRVAKQILSQHIATQLSNHAPGDIMVTGGTSLMLRVPHARITEDVDIITRFYPTKEKLDQLCQSMSQDPNDPFTYTCYFDKRVQSRDGNSFEIDVYLNGQYQNTVDMDAVQARGSELGKDGKFNNEAIEKLQVRDPLLTSHRNNKELTTLQLLSPEKYLAGKIAGLFPIRKGALQEVLRWKDLRDIMILATNVPIDADKFKDALTKLVNDSDQKHKFVIPKPKHIEYLLEQARRNQDFIKRGFDYFHQADRFSIETMVRVMSDLILNSVKNIVWDLKAHDPQLQKLEENKDILPRLSLPEIRDLNLNGWREKTPADINKPPKILDYETGTFKQASATTPRNTSSHASTPDNGTPQQKLPTTAPRQFEAATSLIENPNALTEQPYTPPTQPQEPSTKTKPEENTNNLADGLIEGGSWKGQGLSAPTTQPPHIDNPPPNPQNKENHNQQGLG